MKPLFILICIACLQPPAMAQQPDFILLKQKNKTVASYFPGSTIRFTSISGAAVDGVITTIRNDSFFLKQYVIRQIPTQLGVYVLDTTTYHYSYHYTDIAAINKTGRRFDWASSGAMLLGGGVLLSVAGAVVYLVDKNNFSPELLAASAGLAVAGYFLSRHSYKGMVIGKKFSLHYISNKTD
ncbi:MAG TPA: hypothetical protein PKC39_02950 [Ferruginibacter sp.]|nr:hypothetical protein [Ferruginibacter sp.]HMP19896.1 hypothetical protein [Ferruginibacter sp.]